jgi:hypothetical protein
VTVDWPCGCRQQRKEPVHRVRDVRADVGHLKAGTHTLTAKVTFGDGAKPRTLKLRFSRCTTAKVAPHFTG